MDKIRDDFQKLISHCLKMAEYLLIQQDGEFYPFGFKMDDLGQLSNVGLYDGDDFPLSQIKIDELKKYFEKEIRDSNISAFAITFDCKVQKDGDSIKIDAVAIECFSKVNGQRKTLYFPYRRITENSIEWGESWGENMNE